MNGWGDPEGYLAALERVRGTTARWTERWTVSTHPGLTHEDDSQLVAELAHRAAAMNHRLGEFSAALAHLYGDVDDRVARATAARYRWACTTERTSLGQCDSPLRLPRLDTCPSRTLHLLQRRRSSSRGGTLASPLGFGRGASPL